MNIYFALVTTTFIVGFLCACVSFLKILNCECNVIYKWIALLVFLSFPLMLLLSQGAG